MSKLKTIREIEMERAAQPNFGKGISVASGFDLGAKAPLDSRLTVKTIEERNAHITGNRAYEGMLVYVEADKKTYQLIDNVWEEFGFNEEKFQTGIQPLVDKNVEQDQKLKTLEDLVIGGEGQGIEAVITDVAANKAAIAKEITDRENADTVLDEKITAEVTRATQNEEALSGRLDVIEGEGEGSIKKALVDATADATAKANQALTDAKAYTDTEIEKVNTSNSELEKRVAANETALGLVDGKISTAKTEAIESAKTYTDDEIGKVDTAYKAADAKVLEDAKLDSTQKVDAAKTELNSKIDGLTGRVTTAEEEITKLKDVVSNKNSNTIVVETEAEIATANANPKVGDLAFVITSKRAYIYKGVSAVTAKNAPEGWVVFDEITNELDLVDYLKKDEAESTYRKIATKIAKSDLDTALTEELDGKLNSEQVDTKVSAAVNPVSEKANANESAIAKEVSDRQGEISKVTTRINNFVPVVGSVKPEGTETGHVWLEILAEA